jgi:hypothetical protein
VCDVNPPNKTGHTGHNVDQPKVVVQVVVRNVGVEVNRSDEWWMGSLEVIGVTVGGFQQNISPQLVKWA